MHALGSRLLAIAGAAAVAGVLLGRAPLGIALVAAAALAAWAIIRRCPATLLATVALAAGGIASARIAQRAATVLAERPRAPPRAIDGKTELANKERILYDLDSIDPEHIQQVLEQELQATDSFVATNITELKPTGDDDQM